MQGEDIIERALIENYAKEDYSRFSIAVLFTTLIYSC